MPRARATDPSTSHQAAASVTEKTLSVTKQLILAALEFEKSACDEDLADTVSSLACAWSVSTPSPSGLRSRRADLVEAGLIVDTGERVKTRAGRNSIVWSLAK